LKNLLPAIAGAGLQSLFGNKMGPALTSAVVGAATGLIEGSFDKGMRAGLTAYSGARVTEGLRAAAAARPAVPKTLAEQLGLKESELLNYGDLTKPETSGNASVDAAMKELRKVGAVQTTTPMPAVAPVTTAPARGDGIWEGIKALTRPEGQEAFMSAIEGPYKSKELRDLSRGAVFSGLANIFTKDPKKIPTAGSLSKPRFYVPGERNPKYGQGYDEWYFKPGYYSDEYPGYADGGMISGEERFADGGDVVMVSPEAVLPQQITGASPFTQDRAGLQSYYESLLVPPDNTPRDTSELESYLAFLRDSLKKPYDPTSGDWEYGALPPVKDIIGDKAEPKGPTGTEPSGPAGSAGTPAQPPTTTPEQEPPTEREPLAPPTSIATPAKPSDLGDLFQTPTPIDTPKPTVSVLPVESIIAPEVLPEDMYEPDINEVLKNAVQPPQFSTEPEKKGDVSVTPIEQIIAPEVLPEDMFEPNINEVLRNAIQPPQINIDPERKGVISITPIDEQADAEALQQKLFGDLGGIGQPGFVQPPSTQEIADASQPIVDEILSNLDEQREAEKQEKIDKAKDIALQLGEQALRSAFPWAGVAYDIWKEMSDKEPVGEVSVKELTEEEAAKEAAEEEKKKEGKPENNRGDRRGLRDPSAGAGVGGGAGGAGGGGGGTNRRGVISYEEMPEGKRAGGRIRNYSAGGLGSLQQYAVGGKLVNGAGDGMSDDIKANINGTQEARLADGEFVIPADVVSHLGNGSTDAGAKQLYAMMDRIRKARTGRTRQAPEVEPAKYMPA
jgi:hypothetical protein